MRPQLSPYQKANQLGLAARTRLCENRFDLIPYGFTGKSVVSGYFINAMTFDNSLSHPCFGGA